MWSRLILVTAVLWGKLCLFLTSRNANPKPVSPLVFEWREPESDSMCNVMKYTEGRTRLTLTATPTFSP